MFAMHYVAPLWLPGGHLQTIWPALYSRSTRGATLQYQRQRWTTPDNDFVDVDWLHSATPAAESRPLLVLFHGLEGSSASHYAQAFGCFARDHGMAYAVPHFRGCSGEINRAPRAYHSGDFQEIAWILGQLRQAHDGPIVAVGISLGGNALLRWAQEMGAQAAAFVRALTAVCSPIDLSASGHAIGQGFSRHTYTRMFLKSMKPKALQKWAQYPGLFDREAMLAAQDLYAFDNIFTAPLHGFQNTQHYWTQASAKPRLHDIRIPAFVLNARNDPFVPASSLPQSHEVGPYVTLCQPAQGGHVGFAQGVPPGHLRYLPDSIGNWLLQHTA